MRLGAVAECPQGARAPDAERNDQWAMTSGFLAAEAIAANAGQPTV